VPSYTSRIWEKLMGELLEDSVLSNLG